MGACASVEDRRDGERRFHFRVASFARDAVQLELRVPESAVSGTLRAVRLVVRAGVGDPPSSVARCGLRP